MGIKGFDLQKPLIIISICFNKLQPQFKYSVLTAVFTVVPVKTVHCILVITFLFSGINHRILIRNKCRGMNFR